MTVNATDAPPGVTSNLKSSPTTVSITINAGATAPSLSINGGSGNGQTIAGVTVPFAFSISYAAGANNVRYAQFYLADSGGSGHCYGDRAARTGSLYMTETRVKRLDSA